MPSPDHHAVKFRWLFFDFIPPSFAVDAAARREIRRAVKRDHSLLWSKQALVRTVVAVPALLVVFSITYWLIQMSISARGFRFPVAALLILYPSAYLIGVATYAPLRARQTFQAMYLRGFAICISCGYSHQHLPDSSHVCPECGSPRPSLDELQPTPPSPG